MSADIADRLRALARDHAEGRSSLASYRRLRAPLLDSLVALAGPAADATQPRAAARPLEAIRPRAGKPPDDVTQPREPAPPAAAGRGAPAGAAPRLRGGIGPAAAYAGLGLLLAVIVVALLVWRHHARSAAPAGAAAAAAGGTSAAGQADPIRGLLQPLLEQPDWSNARVLALNEALIEAGRPRIDADRDTDWFVAFVQSVRSRLRQQQALAGAPLTPDSSPLAALAVTLGIDLAAPAQPAREASRRMRRDIQHQAAAAQRTAAPGSAAAQRKGGGGREGARAVQDSGNPTGKSRSAAPARASGPVGSGTERASLAGAGPASTRRAGTGANGSGAAGSELRMTGSTASASAVPSASQARTSSTDAATASVKTSSRTLARHKYPPCSAALAQERLNYCRDFLASGEPAPLLAVIPRGSFMMGNGTVAEERPVHRVTLAYDFAMSVYEVSQSEFQLYCRQTGEACPHQPWTRGDDPVVEVSWHDAQDYARWLSRATHQRYRLPTEAEWEYAARAGQTGLYPSGHSLSPTDAYFSMATTRTAPAPRSMRFNANAWHLMHMVGNVREWVEDTWSPSFSGAPADGSARQQGDPGIKVVRGGCYADPAIRLRLTTREPLAADTRDRCTGIRLVREIP